MRILWFLVLLLPGQAISPQDPAHLEELGVFPDDGTVLGSIADVDILPDGHLLVLDAQANQLFVFSPSGELVRTIGREGEGPGEIKAANDVEVSPSGQIVLLDPGNVRVTIWSSEGELIRSQRIDSILRLGLEWPHELFWSDLGPVLKVTGFRPGMPLTFLLLRDDLGGIKDTISVVKASPEAPTGQFSPFAVNLKGEVLAAEGDTAYSISILDRAGEGNRRFVRDDLPAQRRTEADILRLQRSLDRIPIPPGVEVPKIDIPEFHHRFIARSFDVDQLGRLWTCPTTPDGAPSAFDLFNPDGDFLGSIPVQSHVSGMRIKGMRLLAISETAIGEPVVRMFQIR